MRDDKKRHSRRDDDSQMMDKDGDRGYARRRPRPDPDLEFDYKDVDTLSTFLTEAGRIVPARVSRLSRQQQTQLTLAVKRARQLALIPYAR